MPAANKKDAPKGASRCPTECEPGQPPDQPARCSLECSRPTSLTDTDRIARRPRSVKGWHKPTSASKLPREVRAWGLRPDRRWDKARPRCAEQECVGAGRTYSIRRVTTRRGPESPGTVLLSGPRRVGRAQEADARAVSSPPGQKTAAAGPCGRASPTLHCHRRGRHHAIRYGREAVLAACGGREKTPWAS